MKQSLEMVFIVMIIVYVAQQNSPVIKQTRTCSTALTSRKSQKTKRANHFLSDYGKRGTDESWCKSALFTVPEVALPGAPGQSRQVASHCVTLHRFKKITFLRVLSHEVLSWKQWDDDTGTFSPMTTRKNADSWML